MSWMEDFFVYGDTVFDAFGNHRRENDPEYREFQEWKRRKAERKLSRAEIERELNKPMTVGEKNAIIVAENLFRKQYGIEPPKLTLRQRRWLIFQNTGSFE